MSGRGRCWRRLSRRVGVNFRKVDTMQMSGIGQRSSGAGVAGLEFRDAL